MDVYVLLFQVYLNLLRILLLKALAYLGVARVYLSPIRQKNFLILCGFFCLKIWKNHGLTPPPPTYGESWVHH